MKELIELLGDLVPEGKTVICLDNETRARLDEIYEEMRELMISADEINAERGMGAVSMGFSPYDIERIQTVREKWILGLIHEVENGSKKLNGMIKVTFESYEDIDDEELPF